MALHVAELWRYPVKSMRGEPLQSAEVRGDGIHGDRLIQVQDANGLVTARTRPALLGLHATLGAGGDALVDARHWNEADVTSDVKAAAGPTAALVKRHSPQERFDILPLLVATDGAITAFGQDGRRLRPTSSSAGSPASPNANGKASS